MKSEVIRIEEKMKRITEAWTPKIVEQINDYHIKLARFDGEFSWHKHDETDELFYVVKGEMKIEFRDRSLSLKAGELFVVPRGIEHKPSAEKECQVMLIEPAGTVNTGDVVNDMTASDKDWL